MMREKIREFKDHVSVSLESLVPKDNFYREVEEKLDSIAKAFGLK